jgi:hypothetical protein
MRACIGYLAVMALLAAAGCAPLTVTSGTSPSSSETRELSSPGGFLEVSLKIPARPHGAKPVVINPHADEESLLRSGIIVVRFRADWSVLPGGNAQGQKIEAEPNTVGTWMLAAPRVGIVGRRYFGFIRGNAGGVVSSLIDLLLTQPEIDARRIGFSGSSTNGFIALEALPREPRIAVVVARSACGDYRAFLRDSTLALGGDPSLLTDGRFVLDADYEAELSATEAIGNADRYPPRPLLLLNGAADAAIPLSCVTPTVAALRAAYDRAGASAHFRSMIYEGVGHDLGTEAAEEELAWWKRWLREP